MIRGEHKLADGLARPRVKMVSCSCWMMATPPLVTTALSTWKSMVTLASFSCTSFSFISFRMSKASVTEGREDKEGQSVNGRKCSYNLTRVVRWVEEMRNTFGLSIKSESDSERDSEVKKKKKKRQDEGKEQKTRRKRDNAER